MAVGTADIRRDTTETQITARLSLFGGGKYDIHTGSGFLDHMLELFTRHGRFDLTLHCTGDTRVDLHHTVEDTGIVLGAALAQAAGDKAGINRYGSFLLPMDEALVLAAVDLSGRAHLSYGLRPPTQRVGDFDTELGREFFEALVRASAMTLHLRQLAGENSHHILEAAFKATARALRTALDQDPRAAGEIPSTKGIL